MVATRGTLGIEYIRSDKDTHFTGALAQHAIEIEALSFPAMWGSAGIEECIIEGITIQFEQADLDWDIFLFTTSGNQDTSDLDLDTYLDYFSFTTGIQIAGANQFYYASPSNTMSIPYKDADNTQKLHVGLVNRSATAKNAGATGEIVVQFAVRPIHGI